MRHFHEYIADRDLLSRLWLIETYFSFDPAQYNQLFDDEAHTLSVSSPEHRDAVERMQTFNWVGYIAKSLRNAGWSDQREVQERTHDLVVRMLTGGLFTNYDENKHGPLDLRFKRSVANAIKNMVEKDRNRGRNIPTVPIGQEFTPGGMSIDELPDRAVAHGQDDERVIDDFRRLVRDRLGHLGTAVLDARLAGEETKNLLGRQDIGSPYQVKSTVYRIKLLAHEYAKTLGDPALVRDILRAMAREGATVQKRLNTTAARKDQRG